MDENLERLLPYLDTGSAATQLKAARIDFECAEPPDMRVDRFRTQIRTPRTGSLPESNTALQTQRRMICSQLSIQAPHFHELQRSPPVHLGITFSALSESTRAAHLGSHQKRFRD
jgi:hypothetical protein